jgi:predicted ferric reductase
LWAGTAGAVLAYRVGLPAWRSLRHRLRMAEVVGEGPGVVSVVLGVRALDRFPLSGGQFLQWRFLVRGLWWQAHPYSVSRLPDRDRLRITVKDLGDHSSALARLPPGTRVAIEGPLRRPHERRPCSPGSPRDRRRSRIDASPGTARGSP